jgi:alkyl hydroperoxide reductase subunit AhpF
MSILKIYQGQALRQALAEVVAPVRVLYTSLDQPEPDLLEALTDLQALTPYLIVEINQEAAASVDRLVVQAVNGRELIFVGAPLGTELAALVSALIVAGRGQSGLKPKTRQALAALVMPVHVEVFTTPT